MQFFLCLFKVGFPWWSPFLILKNSKHIESIDTFFERLTNNVTPRGHYFESKVSRKRCFKKVNFHQNVPKLGKRPRGLCDIWTSRSKLSAADATMAADEPDGWPTMGDICTACTAATNGRRSETAGAPRRREAAPTTGTPTWRGRDKGKHLKNTTMDFRIMQRYRAGGLTRVILPSTNFNALTK